MTVLEYIIDSRSLDIDYISQQLGIFKTNLYRYIRGRNIPRANVAVRLADILGVQVEDLFDYEGWREFC